MNFIALLNQFLNVMDGYSLVGVITLIFNYNLRSDQWARTPIWAKLRWNLYYYYYSYSFLLTSIQNLKSFAKHGDLKADSSCVKWRKERGKNGDHRFVLWKYATLPGITIWMSSSEVIVSLCIIVYYYTVCLFLYCIHVVLPSKIETKKQTNSIRTRPSAWALHFTPLILYTY